MARTKNCIRPVEKNISLPETLVAEIDLILYSELEDRVPYGAWRELVQQLLEKHLAKVKGAKNE